jgi:O-methyltransferase
VLEWPQNVASWLIAAVNPHITHNLEKYYALKKVHYMSALEDIGGDYLEFGVFTGSSFCHSMRCCRRMRKFNPNVRDTRFFGFDSFQGFGTVASDDKHPFYTDINFKTSFEQVDKRARKAARDSQYRLVPGFFSESLKDGPGKLGITTARIVFIDSDTYASARDALRFCAPLIQDGTYIILDDFFSYRGSSHKGVARAFDELKRDEKISVRHAFNYGMGGAVYVVSERTADISASADGALGGGRLA